MAYDPYCCKAIAIATCRILGNAIFHFEVTVLHTHPKNNSTGSIRGAFADVAAVFFFISFIELISYAVDLSRYLPLCLSTFCIGIGIALFVIIPCLSELFYAI